MLRMDAIKRYYSDVDACLHTCLQRHCQQLVAAPSIDEKIAVGLALDGLLQLFCAVGARRAQIATDEIISLPDMPAITAAIMPPQGPAALAARARTLLPALSSAILFAPEMPLMTLLVEKLPLLEQRHAAGDSTPPRQPARDAALHWSAVKPFRFIEGRGILDDDANYLGFLFYVLVDVEISAMEICAYMLLDNPDMPDAFMGDMGRQIWDEARHASYIQSLYLERGGIIGAFPYTNTVLERFMSADNLLDGLIVQQLLQEANAVETNLNLATHLQRAAREEETLSFLVINNDEALHARIGNRWLHYLAQRDGLSEEHVFAQMLRLSKKVGLPVFGTGGWRDTLRSDIGFPTWLIEKKKMLLSLT